MIKDDKTSYSFDTAPIEHLQYPRDLRYNLISDFKEELHDKIKGTHKRATEDPTYTTFLKNFGEFTSAKLETKEVPANEYVLEELRSIRSFMASMGGNRPLPPRPIGRGIRALCFRSTNDETVSAILKLLEPFGTFSSYSKQPGHYHITIDTADKQLQDQMLAIARTILPSARIVPNS